jgi:hypothetical protein
MSRKDILDKAYGSVPKEVGLNFDVAWLPSPRGFKYYYLKLVRYFTR